ncbi:unnamed protein product [Rangifer tarandus platyrhynchus]|uniref:Uncharacterized protein n=2 Tax=Rangifer tarandus platyrhynchus TaxID=3082113 RepID=A0ACB0E2T4_RANTA|nr:unnamed protein product [Rangifer tarandus platyrhynchus]CAI9694915.1 unnamed protein product [Rangifer tarandus platyrhynchus]
MLEAPDSCPDNGYLAARLPSKIGLCQSGCEDLALLELQRHLTLGIPTHGYNLVRLYLEMITIKMKLIHYTDYIMIIPHPGRRQSGDMRAVTGPYDA